MRPKSWFSRLRDVKAESTRTVERKQEDVIMSSLNAHRLGDEDDPIAFVKSCIVPVVDSRLEKGPFENDGTPELGRDGGPIPSMSTPGEDPIGLVKSLSVPRTGSRVQRGPFGRHCSHEASDGSFRASMAQNTRRDEGAGLSNGHISGSFMLFLRSAPWDQDLVSGSSCPSFEAEQKNHGICNNNVEECAITSEDTSSSTCSETSSENSTLTSKSSWEDGGHKVCRDVYSLNRLLSADTFESNPDGSTCTSNENSGMNLERSSSNRATKLISSLYHEIIRGRPSLLSRLWTRRRGKSLHSPYLDLGREVTASACLCKGDKGKSSSSAMDGKNGNCSEQGFSLAASNICSKGDFLRHDLQSEMHGMCIVNVREDPSQLGRSLVNRHDVARNNSQSKINSSSCARMVKQLQQGSTEHSSQVQSHTRPQRRRHANMSAVLPPDLQGVVGGSIALVKMSESPYEDFHESISEMIMEKDLEGSRDVEELLYCYLALNSPQHYELIEEVFSDVWSSVLMNAR